MSTAAKPALMSLGYTWGCDRCSVNAVNNDRLTVWGTQTNMDIRKVKKLIELLEESGISEIEIKEGEESVRISRAIGPAMVAAPAPVTQLAVPAAAPAALPLGGSADSHDADIEEGTVIKSPMVGTYYASPSPDSSAFVSVGQTIKPGDTICIVEAMKILNQIESEVSGKIKSILVDDGQPVEFGQPLMIVDE